LMQVWWSNIELNDEFISDSSSLWGKRTVLDAMYKWCIVVPEYFAHHIHYSIFCGYDLIHGDRGTSTSVLAVKPSPISCVVDGIVG
jgi:hypothetical protein